MKIVRCEYLIRTGKFPSSTQWARVERNIRQAIRAVDWPPGTGQFKIFPQSGKKRRQGNGVVPLRRSFQKHLKKLGWSLETRLSIAPREQPGPLDATIEMRSAKLRRTFAVEWETGNVSSSHRALNKMAFGIQRGILIGGALILPTRNLAQYLTDRVGNIEEIEPYFDYWKSIRCKNGILAVFAVEHDATSKRVRRIPKGTDGRALQ